MATGQRGDEDDSPRRREGVRLLSDAPLSDEADDQFGAVDFARALAEILDNESTDTPLTVAVSAPWGAGKTSVASMVQQLLERRVAERDGDREHVICWFNAWDHSDAPHLGAALAAVVARAAEQHRTWWQRIARPLPTAMLDRQARSRRFVIGAITSLAAALLLVIVPDTRGLADTIAGVPNDKLGGLGVFGVLLVVGLGGRRIFATGKDAARFVTNPSSAAAEGAMAEVKDQLGGLISQATRGGRIVIVVDDLERCAPARALEVLQVASQLLGHREVATLLLADMRTIENAAAAAHAGAEGTANAGGVGRRYLEKLLQLEVELPPPRPADVQRLLRGEQPPASTEAAARSDATGRPRRAERSRSASRSAFAERVTTKLLVRSLMALTVIVLIVIAAIPEDALQLTLGLVMLALPLLWMWIAGVAYRRRRRRQRRAVEQHVTKKLEQSSRATPGVTSAQLEDSALAAADRELQREARQAARSYLVVHGPEIEQVEAFICDHPPLLPRAAKRMINHARLLTHIAIDRGMFGGDEELQPAHLGEWIIIRERWPELAARIGAHPEEMHQLEKLANDGGRLVEYVGAVDGIDDLAHLLRQKPQLAPVIERLVRFEPAPQTKPAASTLPAGSLVREPIAP